MDQQKTRPKNQKEDGEFRSKSLSIKERAREDTSTPIHKQKLIHMILEKEYEQNKCSTSSFSIKQNGQTTLCPPLIIPRFANSFLVDNLLRIRLQPKIRVLLDTLDF